MTAGQRTQQLRSEMQVQTGKVLHPVRRKTKLELSKKKLE
jgi:hypothetical protein